MYTACIGEYILGLFGYFYVQTFMVVNGYQVAVDLIVFDSSVLVDTKNIVICGFLFYFLDGVHTEDWNGCIFYNLSSLCVD